MQTDAKTMRKEVNQPPTVELDSFLSRSFLDLEKIDENLFRSKLLWKHKRARGAFGGQIIGQAVVAASDGVADALHLHSLHSYFLRKGDTRLPMLYHVDKTREGRTYCARNVKAVQAGLTVFTMQASFKRKEAFRTTHEMTMPSVPKPDELKDYKEVLGYLHDNDEVDEKMLRYGLEWYESFPIEAKFVDQENSLFREGQYPKRCLWMKARGHIGEDLHENIHKCSLAYMSDLYILGTALLPLSLESRKNQMFLASLDHSIWFHAPCRADEWMLYEIETGHIGDGRAFCHGRIWDINGTLMTTVSQEGVLRFTETSKL